MSFLCSSSDLSTSDPFFIPSVANRATHSVPIVLMRPHVTQRGLKWSTVQATRSNKGKAKVRRHKETNMKWTELTANRRTYSRAWKSHTTEDQKKELKRQARKRQNEHRKKENRERSKKDTERTHQLDLEAIYPKKPR